MFLGLYLSIMSDIMGIWDASNKMMKAHWENIAWGTFSFYQQFYWTWLDTHLIRVIYGLWIPFHFSQIEEVIKNFG